MQNCRYAGEMNAMGTVNRSPNLTQRDAYRIMLKEYPDVMNVEQVSEVLGSAPRPATRSCVPARSKASRSDGHTGSRRRISYAILT